MWLHGIKKPFLGNRGKRATAISIRTPLSMSVILNMYHDLSQTITKNEQTEGARMVDCSENIPPRNRRQGMYEAISNQSNLGDIGHFSARAKGWLNDGFLGKLIKWFFKPTIEGTEFLPKDRGCLVVANHSLPDLFAFAWLVSNIEELDGLTAMSHPVCYRVPFIKVLIKEIGLIPSTYSYAKLAFKKGLRVLVFPGGDYDVMRPFWQASRVDFNGRKGFLRVAKENWVPIVPMGVQGGHISMPILWRSKSLSWLVVFPRLLGIKRWCVTVLGLAGAILITVYLGSEISVGATVILLLLWLGGPLSFLFIIPSKIKYRMGPLIEPEELFGEKDSDNSDSIDYDQAYKKVIDAVQERVRN